MVEPIFEQEFYIEGRNFARAGSVSSAVKRLMKEMGLAPGVVRRLAICVYEAEMNVVAYAEEGWLKFLVFLDRVRVEVRDRGQGIEDIELAMQPGYSTASDELREMGFGAGMGLPNIKRNADNFHIESEVGKGTTVVVEVFLNERPH